MGHRVLVVATSHVTADEASSAIAKHVEGDAEVRVVAPVSGLSWLDWLANSEDDERAAAARRADRLARAVPADRVDSEVGDTDPLQAIDDAMRTFEPDEVVLVTAPDYDTSWLESGAAESARRRFDVPITHLVVR
jgi:GABA permease